jgi:hypothetical protein
MHKTRIRCMARLPNTGGAKFLAESTRFLAKDTWRCPRRHKFGDRALALYLQMFYEVWLL